MSHRSMPQSENEGAGVGDPPRRPSALRFARKLGFTEADARLVEAVLDRSGTDPRRQA